MNAKDQISSVDVLSCLKCLESFVVRRAVCSVPTNQLKRIFISIIKEIPTTDVPTWLVTTLSSGSSGRRWPKDEEFSESLQRYRAYANPLDRCKFVLETIELGYGHKERTSFESATIEHVMPQTLSEKWKLDIGADAELVHDKWIDRLGNLTLSGYNSELSNSPFEKKRILLASSNYELNKWIADRRQWTEAELTSRSALLSNRAIVAWPRSISSVT